MARILVIGPHPDDAELGMGATIALLASQGHTLLLADMTDGEPTPFGDPATRAAEALQACEELSLSHRPLKRVNLGLPNRRVEHSLASRHCVAGLIRGFQAEIIFCPHGDDAHPDHVATTRIVEDARFDAKLSKVDMPVPPGFDAVGPPCHARRVIWYYASHLRAVPEPTFIMDVSNFVGAKMRAIRAYRSQFEANPANRSIPGWIEASLTYFGSRIGTSAGEPFFCREALGLTGLTGMI